MHRFHWLERMEFEGAALVLHLAEMLRGAPDGGLGVPLEIRPDSPRFRVCFGEVGAFKTVPEMFDEISANAGRLEPFLFRESGSNYSAEMKEAMWLAREIPAESLLHYVVLAENVVTHVLAAEPPRVFEVSNNAP
jgi:hypothetical protein